MGEIIRLPWGVSRVAASTLELLEDEERRCLDLSILHTSILRQMVFPWALLPSRLVEDHGDWQEVVEMPTAYLEALEELEILLSGAYDGPKEGCPMGEVYQDRGDPIIWDFQIGDLTVDGGWHSVNLSSIVTDADATLLLLGATFKGSAVGGALKFRESGNANLFNVLQAYVQAPATFTTLQGLCQPGTGRTLDYLASSTLDVVSFLVRGWWRPA
jgi:hypothetical protein